MNKIKYMKTGFWVLFFCGVMIVGRAIVAGNIFVVQKKQDKKVSLSKQKEECTEALIAMLWETPKTVLLIGRLQQLATEICAQMNEGIFFNGATKSQFGADYAAYTESPDFLCQINDYLQRQIDIFEEQLKKYGAKKVK